MYTSVTKLLHNRFCYFSLLMAVLYDSCIFCYIIGVYKLYISCSFLNVRTILLVFFPNYLSTMFFLKLIFAIFIHFI